MEGARSSFLGGGDSELRPADSLFGTRRRFALAGGGA